MYQKIKKASTNEETNIKLLKQKQQIKNKTKNKNINKWVNNKT